MLQAATWCPEGTTTNRPVCEVDDECDTSCGGPWTLTVLIAMPLLAEATAMESKKCVGVMLLCVSVGVTRLGFV